MNTKTVSVPKQIWYEEGTLELEFPESWDVAPCLMNGHHAPLLTPEQVRAALDTPLGSPKLRDLARGKKEVAIIFDDISRPTRVAQLLPHVLEELSAAGIPDGAIRFICATGTHGAHTFQDFEKKLGADILERFPVFNHNPYENCSFVGETSSGNRLHVNSEVMSCDLKIGIGSVIPHVSAGYGGGGKIILPGVASMESIEALHLLDRKARSEGREHTVGLGNYSENPMVKECLEAAKMAGLDFKIDTIVNGGGELCAVFAGETQAEYHEAVRFAERHYATRTVAGADVVVVNNYCKGNEATIGLGLGLSLLKGNGGNLVLIMDFPAGQVVHYLLGSFGKTAKGRLFRRTDGRGPWLKRLVIVSPQVEKQRLGLDDAAWVKSWPEALNILTQDFPNGGKVAVVPDGTIQYLGKEPE